MKRPSLKDALRACQEIQAEYEKSALIILMDETKSFVREIYGFAQDQRPEFKDKKVEIKKGKVKIKKGKE